jgi:hypothetical protein
MEISYLEFRLQIVTSGFSYQAVHVVAIRVG